jgi:hypothetical protein
MSTTAALSGLSGSGATVSWTPATGATSYDIALYYKLSGAPTTSDTLVQTFTNRTSPATLSFTPNSAGGYYAATVTANYNSQISGTSIQALYQPSFDPTNVITNMFDSYYFSMVGNAPSSKVFIHSSILDIPSYGTYVFKIGVVRGFTGISVEFNFSYDASTSGSGEVGTINLITYPGYSFFSFYGQQSLTTFNTSGVENVTQLFINVNSVYGTVLSNVYIDIALTQAGY